MSELPTKDHFVNAYADKAPWDIGKPQRSFIDAAHRITGAILDAGCGTGENSLFLAQQGRQVTGIDYLDEPIRRASTKPPSAACPSTSASPMRSPWATCTNGSTT